MCVERVLGVCFWCVERDIALEFTLEFGVFWIDRSVERVCFVRRLRVFWREVCVEFVLSLC